MTRYPSWRKHEVRRDGKNILAVFILIVLVFATANGIAKSFSLKKYLIHLMKKSDLLAAGLCHNYNNY